jgi:hypothetical protein
MMSDKLQVRLSNRGNKLAKLTYLTWRAKVSQSAASNLAHSHQSITPNPRPHHCNDPSTMPSTRSKTKEMAGNDVPSAGPAAVSPFGKFAIACRTASLIKQSTATRKAAMTRFMQGVQNSWARSTMRDTSGVSKCHLHCMHAFTIAVEDLFELTPPETTSGSQGKT